MKKTVRMTAREAVMRRNDDRKRLRERRPRTTPAAGGEQFILRRGDQVFVVQILDFSRYMAASAMAMSLSADTNIPEWYSAIPQATP